jgi:hypothetical protein
LFISIVILIYPLEGIGCNFSFTNFTAMIRYTFLLIVSFCFTKTVVGQTDSKNRIRVKLVLNTKDTMDCFANLSLNGENGTAFGYEKINKSNTGEIDFPFIKTSWVSAVIFNGETYLIGRVYKEGYSIWAEGCLLKKEYGIDSFALYKWNDGQTDKQVALLPERIEDENKFVLIENRHYRTPSTWTLGCFKKCPELKTLVRTKVEGWVLTETMTLEDRIAMWKKYIDKYKTCTGQ